MKRPAQPRELGVALKAQLAMSYSAPELPPRLKHLVLVLALHANYYTGYGFTGQTQLARYMGLGARQVRRLWSELDEAAKRGLSPVEARREARHHSSDGYTLIVREGAWIAPASGPEALVHVFDQSQADTGDSHPDTGDFRADTQGRSSGHPGQQKGGQPDAHDLLTSQRGNLTVNLAVREELHSLGTPAAGGGRPEIGGESSRRPPKRVPHGTKLRRPELETEARRLWPELYAELPSDDGASLSARRYYLRQRAKLALESGTIPEIAIELEKVARDDRDRYTTA